MVANGDKSAPPTIKELWQGFNETTTAHGLPRAYQYKGKSHADTDLFYLPKFITKKYIIISLHAVSSWAILTAEQKAA